MQRAAAGQRKMRVLTINPAIMPSVVIGVLRPLSRLEKEGAIALRVRLSRDWREDDIKWADTVIFCRNQDGGDVEALYQAHTAGKTIIYEIDDNFFEISLGLPLGRWHREPGRLHGLKRFLQYADLVRVYSEALRDQVVRFQAPVELIRSYFDAGIIEGLSRPRRRSGDPVRIAFASGRSPDPAMEHAMNASLARVCETYGKRVSITFWRKPPPTLARFEQVKAAKPVTHYERFVRDFYREGFDIGLAPVLDDVFHNSKTNNKYREYGGCGVAGIYSDVRLYRACVTHGVNGMLAANSVEAWSACLSELVEKPDLRDSITAAAREDVLENYTLSGAVESWRRHLFETAPALRRGAGAR